MGFDCGPADFVDRGLAAVEPSAGGLIIVMLLLD
jgi:hypothetical protein